ncbi:ricin-type beta-trefoil lectin domain protein [Kribbella sp. CA-294648]|uniref:ricin-type beta-trefoil lectin domain protein n=1 Tax=Kribbella sp. CA-294648 TaxID=3239948 RepID=UPI003D913D9C
MRTAVWRSAAAALVLVTSTLVAAPAIAPPATATTTATTDATASATNGPASTREFRGVNWADPRDNYASDEVVPSGLSTADGYAATYRKATGIVGEFRKELKANTIRLPINPSSVGTDWWKSYRGAIDAATGQGFKVILSYWEANDAKDGRVDNPAAYDAMWSTVVAAYGKNPRVYFEPMNEPFGYSLDEWVSLTSSWLAKHKYVPRGRVVISGTGYNDNVTGVGAAAALKGTLLSLHFYGFWDDATTEQEWLDNLRPRIGEYGWRTIIDEAGSPMTIGLNYGNHEGNVSTAYFGALTQVAREQGMGVVYWPGLRTGDSYSLTTLVGTSDLTVNSASGLAQLHWGWGLLKTEPVNDLPPAPPGEQLRGVASGRCLDVPGFSTTDGTALDLWDCNGGGNQAWHPTADKQITIYGTKCLTPNGSTAGSPAIITGCTGGSDQTWEHNPDLSISSIGRPGLCLEASGTANGSPVIVSACNGQSNQQWEQ